MGTDSSGCCWCSLSCGGVERVTRVEQVTGQKRAEQQEAVMETTYLRKALLPAFSFVVGHLDDLTDLLDEGLALTLQNELTLHLKHKSTSSRITHRPGLKEKKQS